MIDLTRFERIEEINVGGVCEYTMVNKYLKAGWKLFATRTEVTEQPEGPTQDTIYCLGWPEGWGSPIEAEDMTIEEIKAELKRREEALSK